MNKGCRISEKIWKTSFCLHCIKDKVSFIRIAKFTFYECVSAKFTLYSNLMSRNRAIANRDKENLSKYSLNNTFYHSA